jgi:magnesium-transporting ATPase (P-type)
VGAHSEWGKIKANLEKEDSPTPLQEKLEKLADKIGKMGTVAAFLTFTALILKVLLCYPISYLCSGQLPPTQSMEQVGNGRI